MLGAIMGMVVIVFVNMEPKWMLAALLVSGFVILVLAIDDRERFFWVLFIMSLQAYISFRFMHGRAGSAGLEFTLAFVTGNMLLGYYFLSGSFSTDKAFRMGGDFAVPISLVFASTFISLFFTSERFVGLTSLWTLIQYYTFYLIGLNCVQNKKWFDRVISLLIIVLLIQSMVYLLQAFMGVTFTLTGEIEENSVRVRAGGTVGSNSAIYTAFVVPLMMLVFVRVMSNDPAIKKRMFWFGVAFISAIVFVLTLRRAAWGGFFLGMLCVLYLGYRRRLLARAWIKTGVLVLLAILIISPVIVKVVDTYRTGNPLDSAFDERMRLNRIAWELIKANPLHGTGPGSYSHVYKGYVQGELGGGWLYTVHNTYLLEAAEKGFPGLIALCLFLLYSFRLGYRLMSSPDKNIQRFGLAMTGYIVCYAFHIYWEPLASYAPNALLWFLAGLMSSARRISGEISTRYG